jgi:hypothetical protein
MAGAFEAVHVGVRKPGEEVLEVPVRKDGIPGAPEHQRRDPQPAQPFRHAAERREAGVGRVHGNVRHKVPHPGPAAGSPVRRHVGLADPGWQRRVRQRVCHPQKGVRRRRSPLMHCRVQGKPQGRRDIRTRGLVDGRVGQHHRGELLRVREGPAEADHAAPVVAHRNHRPLQVQGIRQVAQVVDPVCQAPERARALRVAHVQLVHRHNAPRVGRIRTGSQQRPPQI